MSLKQALVRAVYPYGSVRRVLRGPCRGMLFIIQPGMGLNYVIGSRLAAPRYFAHWIKPGAVVFDVGANKGQMCLLYSRLVGPSGKVVSFEPAPSEFKALEKNIAASHARNAVAINAAASEHSGTVEFHFNPEHSSQGKMATVEPDYVIDNAQLLRLPAVTLDEVAEKEGAPDFIKIDVEGGARLVFAGAQRVLDKNRPTVFIELHGPEEQQAVKDHLGGRGYTLKTLEGLVVKDPTAAWNTPLVCHP